MAAMGRRWWLALAGAGLGLQVAFLPRGSLGLLGLLTAEKARANMLLPEMKVLPTWTPPWASWPPLVQPPGAWA